MRGHILLNILLSHEIVCCLCFVYQNLQTKLYFSFCPIQSISFSDSSFKLRVLCWYWVIHESHESVQFHCNWYCKSLLSLQICSVSPKSNQRQYWRQKTKTVKGSILICTPTLWTRNALKYEVSSSKRGLRDFM
jgi:hypothetical protein